MTTFEIQLHNDVADFSRRVNAKWPDTVRAWNETNVSHSTVTMQAKRQQSPPSDKEIVLKTPNSNAQGVG